MPDAAERTQVRGTLHAVSLTAWMLIIIDAVSMGSSIGHNITTGHNATTDGQPLGLLSLAAGWLLMLAAMMTPFLTTPVQHLRACNLARRRARAVTLFIAGYLVVWLTAGILLTNAAAALLPLGQTSTFAATVTIGLAWHATPARDHCLNRTHSHPALRAFGLPGDIAALHFGVRHALCCVGTCWAMMLLPLVVTPGLALLTMSATTLWLTAEHLERPTPPRWQIRIPTTAAHKLLRTAQRALPRHQVALDNLATERPSTELSATQVREKFELEGQLGHYDLVDGA